MTQQHLGRWHIGTSGYQYAHWKGPFYPEELADKDCFQYYARHFDTVEINNTFYHLPEAEVFSSWRDQAPAHFCYALKFSRYGSHLKRLKDPEATIEHFIERASQLESTLGPILVQLPPRWNVNVTRLAEFLAAAPRDYRWAIEFRDPRWLNDDVYQVLRNYNAALCIHDMIEDHPLLVTADWVYLRFHGNHYQGSYSTQFLSAKARHLANYLSQGLDVFGYFNNDQQGFAVRNAIDFKRYLVHALESGNDNG